MNIAGSLEIKRHSEWHIFQNETVILESVNMQICSRQMKMKVL